MQVRLLGQCPALPKRYVNVSYWPFLEKQNGPGPGRSLGPGPERDRVFPVVTQQVRITPRLGVVGSSETREWPERPRLGERRGQGQWL